MFAQAIEVERQTVLYLMSRDERIRCALPSPCQDLLNLNRPLLKGSTPLIAQSAPPYGAPMYGSQQPGGMYSPASGQPRYPQRGTYPNANGQYHNYGGKRKNSRVRTWVTVIATCIGVAFILVCLISMLLMHFNDSSSKKGNSNSPTAISLQTEPSQDVSLETSEIEGIRQAPGQTQQSQADEQLASQTAPALDSQKAQTADEAQAAGPSDDFQWVTENFGVKISSVSFQNGEAIVVFDYENRYNGGVGISSTSFHLNDQVVTNNWTERMMYGGDSSVPSASSGQFTLIYPGVVPEFGSGFVLLEFMHFESLEAADVSHAGALRLEFTLN